MSRPLEFWFEFGSTYSYPAAHRVESRARDRGVDVVWRPFLLGPIFAAQGWNDSPFNLYPAKGRYMWRDWGRICSAAGLRWVRPSVFPRNGLLAARVACCFDEAPWQPEFVRRIYTANYADDRDVSDDAVVAEAVTGAGGDAEGALRDARTQGSKDKLRAQTERAALLGIFGAPTFTVGDEIFWGNDRLETALDWLAA